MVNTYMIVEMAEVTVRVFEQDFAIEDAIGSHACSLEANIRVTIGIPLGSPLRLTVAIINYAETLKAPQAGTGLSSATSGAGACLVPLG
jgi:hypothetical protein